ncbi:MAG: ribonuclease H family protein [Candidatus Liptonbacteria bacterium]|nr:ribonuclease H family protein [Candidatus Liptonbacteria bacterium]
MSSSGGNKFYAYFVPRTGKNGIAGNWEDCKKIVSGEEGARYKGFKTKEEAGKWLKLGANYEIKILKKPQPGIYFDAGTGRGKGVEISVTDEKGKNLLHKSVPKELLNKFGKYLLDSSATNNYGELLAMYHALEIAGKKKIKKVFGDSKLVIDYWSKWTIKRKELLEETVELAERVSRLRSDFEKRGGKVKRISGDDNPADLGFHK